MIYFMKFVAQFGAFYQLKLDLIKEINIRAAAHY